MLIAFAAFFKNIRPDFNVVGRGCKKGAQLKLRYFLKNAFQTKAFFVIIQFAYYKQKQLLELAHETPDYTIYPSSMLFIV